MERLGRNQLVFREVNERIREIAGRFSVPDLAIFICECGQASCAEAIELRLEEYDALRASPGTFVVIPGHEAPHELVVATKKHYNAVGVRRQHAVRLHEGSV